MQRITILGATGSIGLSTLDVVKRHPDKYSVFAITAYRNLEKLVELAQQVQPQFVVAANEQDYARLTHLLRDANVQSTALAGSEGLQQVSSDDEVDVVMAAIVGAAGLMPTFAAVGAGKKVLLANKESLVMSGNLLIDLARQTGAQILPVDSEHNAIFQALPRDFEYAKLSRSGISKLLLTGSGGPFLTREIDTLDKVTVAEACAHPNWSMGQKISVDSATMMNKGLEFIEACWLFGVTPADIEVVIHPQSVIHSMVQYKDGSVLAQMGNPDMRTPIAHCLAYPERIASGVEPLDFAALVEFTFLKPDFTRFPNLKLAIDACGAGQFYTAALNASNEIAVDAFLNKKIKFTDIANINLGVLEQLAVFDMPTIEHVVECDRLARQIAKTEMNRLN